MEKYLCNMDVIFSAQQINEVAQRLLQALDTPAVVALHGPMGAGKTTLVRAVAEALGVTETVNSPTFSLIQEYRLPSGQPFYHLDLYRLADADEAWQSGVDEVLNSGHWCWVEWPEKAAELFPPNTKHVWLSVQDTLVRRLQIHPPNAATNAD